MLSICNHQHQHQHHHFLALISMTTCSVCSGDAGCHSLCLTDIISFAPCADYMGYVRCCPLTYGRKKAKRLYELDQGHPACKPQR